MNTPNWLKVLEFYERNRIVWNGLTVPFLIGAERLLDEKQFKYSVEDFFEDVHNLSTPLTILKCSQILEFVIGTLDTETQILLTKKPNIYLKIGNLICVDESLNGFKSVDDLITFCSAKYRKLIQKGTFSLQNGAWGPFDDHDLENIKRSVIM